MSGQGPVNKFKCGAVEAAIFENQVTKNGKTFSMSKAVLQRNYLDKNEQWQSTSSFDANDIPKAILVLSKAYEYLMAADSSKNGRDSRQDQE